MSDIRRRNSFRGNNADQVSERSYRLSESVRTCNGNLQAKQRLSCGGKVLTIDQIRRSSRSVCTNLREAWAKRRYEAHFVSKLTDADGENGETETWLDFAHDCDYLSKRDHALFTEKCHEVGAMLGSMINNPSSFILR